MLKTLRIENYALVDNLEITFGPGLTVLTGETGAGKSVIIGGLLLALGARADRDHIRHGAPRAAVEAGFDLSTALPLQKKIHDELETVADDDLRLSREVELTGSAKSFANGRQVSLAKIRAAAALLADFHSQQGHRNLLDIEQHRHFLDAFAGLAKKAERLALLYAEFTACARQLAEACAHADAMREKLELINFQVDELSKAAIRVGEEQELDAERRRLESMRVLMEAAQAVVTGVSDCDGSVLVVLSQLDRQLKQAAGIDERLAAESRLLTDSIGNLNELTRNLESYLSRLEDDPARLETINERLAELFRLRKKYRTDEAGLLEALENLQKQSLGAGDYGTLIKNLTQKLTTAKQDYYELALEVSRQRRQAARRLETDVEKQLADLAITKARFTIEFQVEYDENGFAVDNEKLAGFAHGLENVEFLISTNPNEPIKPLVKIASGGELSRIMLALLTVIAGKYHLPTIIFDEIDTGIGGVTAVKLGEKLKQLSKKHQVIAISHLPAVASQADHHLAVGKSLRNGRNIISVKEVRGADLKKELARMGGKQ